METSGDAASWAAPAAGADATAKAAAAARSPRLGRSIRLTYPARESAPSGHCIVSTDDSFASARIRFALKNDGHSHNHVPISAPVCRKTAIRARARPDASVGRTRDAMTIPASPSTSKWGVSEIVVADCHHGPEGPGAPPLRAYRLMQTGNVARTTVDGGDSLFARDGASPDGDRLRRSVSTSLDHGIRCGGQALSSLVRQSRWRRTPSAT